METAVIRFDFRNIVTVSICGALGYLAIVGINKGISRVNAMRNGGA